MPHRDSHDDTRRRSPHRRRRRWWRDRLLPPTPFLPPWEHSYQHSFPYYGSAYVPYSYPAYGTSYLGDALTHGMTWPFVPVVSASTPTGCLADGQSRQGVLFLESNCAGFPTGARCCNDQHEVAFCQGNVEGGMSVGTLHCLPKDRDASSL